MEISKFFLPLHPQTRDMYPRETSGVLPEIKDGPFVYRLGRKIFILERGVRFPHGLRKRSELLFRPFLLYSTLILSEDYTQTETGMILPLNVASQCLRLVRSITVVAGYMESPFLSCRINFQTDFRRNVESP